MRKNLLFVQDIGNPEDTLSLFQLDGIQPKPRTAFVQADAMCQADCCGYQGEGGLGIGGTLKKQRLEHRY